RGWMISGVQTILNPNDNRIPVEEGNGTITTFAINDTIATLYQGDEDEVDLDLGVDLSTPPRALVASGNSNRTIWSLDLEDGRIGPSHGTIPMLVAKRGINAANIVEEFWDD